MGSRPSRVPEIATHTRKGGGDANSTRAILLAAALVLHAAVWWRAIAWYPDLPDSIPTHFDAGGVPDGWAAKSSGAWFLLPGIALGLMVFLGAIGWGLGALVRSSPGLCNMPRKELFVRLSPEGRMVAVAPTRTFLLATLAIFQGMFVWMVEGSARVAVSEGAVLPSWPVFVCVGAVLVLLWPYYLATGRAVVREAEREGVAGGGLG
jgi:hypothetical protein